MAEVSDPPGRKTIVTLILKHHRKAIVLSFVAGIIWFLALASYGINNRTYFSENALLPGLVVREFNPGSSSTRLLEILKEEIADHPSLPHAWIQGQFRQIGLDVYVHNFTLHYPFGLKPRYNGNNVYAILRAPKSCSTEALVLTTPFRGRDSIHDSTLPSIVLMIELARYFRQHAYWSKDIIFLISEHEMIGFQAWLNAYHNIPVADFLDHGSLAGSSGLIQAVINLEISSVQFSHIDVKIEGLNGQLPNLDMFNLVVELCFREMITPLFQGQETHAPVISVESWIHNLKTMLSMMGMQSMGLPTGAHGLFHRFGIQAVTLASRKYKSKNAQSINLVHLGRVVEGVFRSLNNLLEKFHQSFFFYLLPSAKSYVSIGLYMPPFSLITAPILVMALNLYLNMRVNAQKMKDLKFDSVLSLWHSLDLLAVCHCFGLLIYFSPVFVNFFQSYTTSNSEDTLYYLHVVLLITTVLFIFINSKRKCLDEQHYNVKVCVTLLELGAFLFTLSLINISLATVLSLMYIPIGVSVRYKGILSSLRYIYLIIINPLSVTFLVVLCQSYYIHIDETWLGHMGHALSGHKKVVLYTVEDMYFFGNWNYKIASLVVLPLWLELWSLVSTRRI